MTAEILTLIALLCTNKPLTCAYNMVDCVNKHQLEQLAKSPKADTSGPTSVAICIKQGKMQ